MEFEVTGGTVNFATMAMADSSDFDNVFDLNQAKPTYDEATGALIGTQKKKKYFALGYIADTVSGVEEYNWIYKGKFTGGNKTHNTKNDGTDATNMEYTYTSIQTAVKFAKAGNKPCKYLSVDNDGKANLDTFFDKVTTPDDLKATA